VLKTGPQLYSLQLHLTQDFFLKQFPQLSRSRNVQLHHQDTSQLTVASEALFPSPGSIYEQQPARDKHKRILEDRNTKKIEKVKNSFYTKANLRPRFRTTNQWLQNETEAAVRRWSWNVNWKMLCLWPLCKRGSTMVQTRRL
jgi:Ni,Fe-hydrogenase I large subunit